MGIRPRWSPMRQWRAQSAVSGLATGSAPPDAPVPERAHAQLPTQFHSAIDQANGAGALPQTDAAVTPEGGSAVPVSWAPSWFPFVSLEAAIASVALALGGVKKVTTLAG